jgi:hypothetical protein
VREVLERFRLRRCIQLAPEEKPLQRALGHPEDRAIVHCVANMKLTGSNLMVNPLAKPEEAGGKKKKGKKKKGR